MPNALVCVTTRGTHKVSQKTGGAGQPEARAHNFQFAWHQLTLLGKFSSLCTEPHTAAERKRENQDAQFYSCHREKAFCALLWHADSRRWKKKGRTADGIQCWIVDQLMEGKQLSE